MTMVAKEGKLNFANATEVIASILENHRPSKWAWVCFAYLPITKAKPTV
jgi:hypothetical protein